jgi:hypothetical protein
MVLRQGISSLPPLRGVSLAGRFRGLSPPANFGQALRASGAGPRLRIGIFSQNLLNLVPLPAIPLRLSTIYVIPIPAIIWLEGLAVIAGGLSGRGVSYIGTQG